MHKLPVQSSPDCAEELSIGMGTEAWEISMKVIQVGYNFHSSGNLRLQPNPFCDSTTFGQEDAFLTGKLLRGQASCWAQGGAAS